MSEEVKDREALIALTSDVVAAHVSNNSVNVDQLPILIANVFNALSNLGRETAPEVEAREPAVPVRSSVKPDHVTCLECGRKMKMLKRHLMADHGLTTEEYRERWGLAQDHPLVAPNYADHRRNLAKAIGLGRGGRGGRGLLKKAEAAPVKTAETRSKSPGRAKAGRKLGLRFKETTTEGAA